MQTLLIHTFTRHEVETLDFQRFEAIFGHWPQLWARELRPKLDSLVLLVDSYSDHPDEVYLIPEVRAFYRALHQRWPWWCYFLNLESQSLQMAYLCLIDSVQSIKRDGSPHCAAAFNPSEIADILMADLGRMNWLWVHAGLPECENDHRSKQILNALKGGVSYG